MTITLYYTPESGLGETRRGYAAAGKETFDEIENFEADDVYIQFDRGDFHYQILAMAVSMFITEDDDD